MKIYKAPQNYDTLEMSRPSIFLAGSIEMGKAENWQTGLENTLNKYHGTILNPRRNDWDNSWIQSIINTPFREQVLWELQALKNSDIIFMYFDPKTKSPISLLELGLFAKTPKLIVCCPDGYW
jgi:hypothetical protein